MAQRAQKVRPSTPDVNPRDGAAAPRAYAVARRTGGGGGGGAGVSLRHLRTFSSFENPVFRIYYASMMGQMASMNMAQVAQALLAYRITGSAAILGVVALANAVPMVLLSLFGGVLADRVSKKKVLLAGQAAAGLVPLTIGVALATGYVSSDHPGSWWVLVAAALFQGTVWSLVMPSRQALLTEIVDEKDWMNAVALNNLGMNVFRMLSPAIAGFSIDLFGFAPVYFMMAGLYLVAVAFTLLLPAGGASAIQGGKAWSQIKDGIHYVRQEATILLILGFTLVTVVLSMPYQTLLPVFTEDRLDVGASGLGLLFSVSGIGALVGSVALASMPNTRRGAVMLGGSLILGVALAAFAFSTSWPLSLSLMAFVGLGQAARMTLSNALLLHYTKEEYLGRVMSIYMMEFGLSSFAAFLAGVTAQVFGIQWSIGGLAMALVIVSIAMLAFVPRMRRLA